MMTFESLCGHNVGIKVKFQKDLNVDKKTRGKVGQSWLQKVKTRHVCYSEYCKNKTSLNHLLQENGILSLISTDRCVYQLTGDRFKDTFYNIKKVGLNNAFTFNGFCSSCDNYLFSDIEKRKDKIPNSEIDFCRLSIRPILNEMRKKQNNKLWWRDNPDPRYSEYRSLRSCADDMCIDLFKQILDKCYSVIAGVSRDIFSYTIRLLDKVDVCICSIRIPPQFLENSDLSSFIFNIVICYPINDKSLMISGSLKVSPELCHIFTDRIRSCTDTELKEKITGMMIHQVEDWCVSEKIYYKVAEYQPLINDSKLNLKFYYLSNSLNFFE